MGASDNSQSRRGISLTEVLISMGLLAIGLLGVAAMFPVGSYYMLKGEISDRGAAAAQAAFADLVSRGMLQPEAWVAYEGRTGPPDAFGDTYNAGTRGLILQAFGQELRDRVVTGNAYVQKQPLAMQAAARATVQARTSHEFGYAFVLDPMGIASVLSSSVPPTAVQMKGLSRFPPCSSPKFNAAATPTSPWRHFTTGSGPGGHEWPVRRLTVWDPLSGQPLRYQTAEVLFRSFDDLALELPEQNDHPGQTRWDSADFDGSGQQNALTRQARGDYSWIASITPTTGQARDGLATQPSSHLYDVSVVVFHKRVLSDPAQLFANEVLVRGHVSATGVNGGEMILNSESQLTGSAKPFDELKTGQYVMVTGPHPESSAESPRLFLQWYRVLSVDEEPSFDGDTLPEVRVALRGPDWPWQPNVNSSGQIDLTDPSKLPNDLRIGIFPGAVAVHTKTMRLSGGANSGSPWAASGTIPPTTDPPYVRY